MFDSDLNKRCACMLTIGDVLPEPGCVEKIELRLVWYGFRCGGGLSLATVILALDHTPVFAVAVLCALERKSLIHTVTGVVRRFTATPDFYINLRTSSLLVGTQATEL